MITEDGASGDAAQKVLECTVTGRTRKILTSKAARLAWSQSPAPLNNEQKTAEKADDIVARVVVLIVDETKAAEMCIHEDTNVSKNEKAG